VLVLPLNRCFYEQKVVSLSINIKHMSRKLTNEELAMALIKLKKEFNQLNDKVERMAEYLRQQHIKTKK
jgi:predicted Zn-dependent peptidase